MPIDFLPRDRMPSAPRSGYLKDAWNQQLKAYGKNPGSMLGGFGEFEEGQTVKVESGRVELNANDIIAGAIKQPAYALEAPLRPFNVATGGGVGNALESAWGFGKSIPVLGLAFNALEGVGGVLEASNKAGKAFLNYTLAEHLKQSRGKPDNWESSFMGETLTAGEVRKRVMARWSTNPLTGEEYSLAQLEARAMENTMNFGELNVHENGALNFGAQILADPINIGLLGGGTIIGLTGKAVRAASWARPAVNLGTRIAGVPRIGYGALKATGRVVTQTPTGAKFMDEFSAARAAMNGQLAEHATLAGLLRATSWSLRGLYVPGYAAARAQGRGVLRAGSTAYIRGGIQQQVATNAAEQLLGMSNGWIQDKGLDTKVQDGFTSWVHDALNKINNDHPLSDYEGFVVAALFSPWASAIGNARSAYKATRTKAGLPAYADNTLREVKDSFRREFGINAKYDDMFKAMGKGDIAAGKAAWEWFVDQMDVIKAGNQLTSFTRQIVEADDIALRTQFLTKTAVEKVKFLREKAALQPKSTADFMIDALKNGPKDVAGETLASQMSITPEVFYNFVGQMYRANLDQAPQIAKLGGIQLEQGAPVTRELLDAIIEQLDQLPAGSIIDRDMAAQIMGAGPSLVWESEFLSRFTATLGQRQPGGRFGRPVTAGENVTHKQLADHLRELRESAPSSSELFHEAVAASKNATRIKPGETLLTEPPYPLPTKLEARRVYNTGRVRQLIRTINTLRDVRNAEFFKNGKPRIKAAKELSGHEGGVFKRVEIDKPIPEWVDPGPKPDWGSIADDLSEEAHDAAVASLMAAEREWTTKMSEGVFAGKITPEAAKDLGWNPMYGYGRMERLPSELYHATTDVAGVKAKGLMTRRESGRLGLGGGPDDVISFTDDAATAQRIADVLVEAGQIIRGEKTLAQLAEVARSGKFYKKWYDQLTAPMRAALRGKRTVRDAKFDTLKGKVVNTTRSLTDQEYKEAVYEAYRRFLISQEAKTGLLDPYIFGTQVDELAKIFPENTGVITARPAAERAIGMRAGTMGEWRTTSSAVKIEGGPRVKTNTFMRDDGMAFTVEDGVISSGVEGFPMSLDSEALVLAAQNGGRTIVFPRAEGQFLADHGFVEVASIRGTNNAAYAFRGGDVTKIVENSKAGAFAPYRPATKEVATEATALKLARKNADAASITDPSTYASRRMTKDSRYVNPEDRLNELNRLRAQADAERRSLMKQISESDRLAMELAGIDMKVAKLGDWFNAASKTEVDNLVQLVKDVNRDYPSLSVREGQGLWVDPRADRFSTLLTHRSLARRMAFDYGYLSPINFLYTALIAPVNARFIGKQAQTEMHNLLAQSGFSAKESKKFAELLRKEVMDSRSIEGTLGERSGTHMYRTVRAVPEGKVLALLEEVAPGKSAEIMKRWGTPQRMLTEASNRMLRNAAKVGRGGGRIDPLSRAMNNAFRIWQYTPGLMPISSATHNLTKFLYPMIRFGLDPFYHVMNVLEPDMYGISMEGTKASRWSKGIVNRAQSSNAAKQSSVTSIPPGGLLSKDVPLDMIMADTGAYTMPRSIRPIMERHFDIKRFDSADDVWRAVKYEDPAARVMVEHFGDDVADWVKAGDEMMYGYMTKGPEATVMGEARAVLDDMGINLDEAKHLVPHIERLASAHRGQYNDLVQLYIGRLNRPGIERLLDNFWLMWPLSYQIKATTWLAEIMFKRIGGVNLGLAPAAMWTEYRERFEQSMESDYEFKNWVDTNDAFLFAFEMAFPMTPQGIGASMSRPTRYVGSWIADGLEIPQDLKEQFIGDYPQIRTIPELLENSIIVGPARTERLFKRIMDRFEVPGFTIPEAPPSSLPELPR